MRRQNTLVYTTYAQFHVYKVWKLIPTLMRSISDLTPERVLDIYEKHEHLNFHKNRDLRDSAIAEHLQTT